MSAPLPSGPPYTRAQRWVALGYGVLCHALFAASVAVMFVSLYTGLTSGLLHLHGWKAVLADAVLLLQFAVAHSFFLSDRGRRLLNGLLPLGLGRDLATTSFATIASLQLLATFALWSPSGIVWMAPEGPVKQGLTVAYVASWLLLAKSMHDAGLDVQIGSLGWTSVWRNQRPVYQPFARSGTFRHSRQPIYSSFTLILWTAPVWTPDHLVLTVLWTGYCVLAPLAKEKRYRRFYGEAFARYQQTVPYWFPARHPRSMIPPLRLPCPGHGLRCRHRRSWAGGAAAGQPARPPGLARAGAGKAQDPARTFPGHRHHPPISRDSLISRSQPGFHFSWCEDPGRAGARHHRAARCLQFPRTSR